MRKLLYSAVLSLLTISVAEAQTERQFIRTSIVAGVGAHQIEGDEMKGFNKPGLILGAAARFAITDQLSFHPEVLYIQKGARTTSDQEQELGLIVRWRLPYVTIPLLLSYEIFPKFTLMGGGAYGYLLGAKLDEGGGYNDMYDRLNFNRSDLLWVGGLEYQIFDELSLDLRIERSLISIRQDIGFFNNSVGVSLRYHLGQQ